MDEIVEKQKKTERSLRFENTGVVGENQYEALYKARAARRAAGYLRPTPFVGTCMEKCPEFERHEREIHLDLNVFEIVPGTEKPRFIGDFPRIDHSRAVKKYHRPAAGNEAPFPEDVRPASILLDTLDYLVYEIWTDDRFGLLDRYHFIRDRTRSIRQDLTLQNDRSWRSIVIHERIARFHILCGHLFCEEDSSSFDSFQNTEQLRKVLQTLQELYSDKRAVKGDPLANNTVSELFELEDCEAEFRSYYILTHLLDRDVFRKSLSWSNEVFRSVPVQTALRYVGAFRESNTRLFFKILEGQKIRDGNEESFKKRSNERRVAFLQACLLHSHFDVVRREGMNALRTAKLLPEGIPPLQQGVLDEAWIVRMFGLDSRRDISKLFSSTTIPATTTSSESILTERSSMKSKSRRLVEILWPASSALDYIPLLVSDASSSVINVPRPIMLSSRQVSNAATNKMLPSSSVPFFSESPVETSGDQKNLQIQLDGRSVPATTPRNLSASLPIQKSTQTKEKDQQLQLQLQQHWEVPHPIRNNFYSNLVDPNQQPQQVVSSLNVQPQRPLSPLGEFVPPIKADSSILSDIADSLKSKNKYDVEIPIEERYFTALLAHVVNDIIFSRQFQKSYLIYLYYMTYIQGPLLRSSISHFLLVQLFSFNFYESIQNIVLTNILQSLFLRALSHKQSLRRFIACWQQYSHQRENQAIFYRKSIFYTRRILESIIPIHGTPSRLDLPDDEINTLLLSGYRWPSPPKISATLFELSGRVLFDNFIMPVFLTLETKSLARISNPYPKHLWALVHLVVNLINSRLLILHEALLDSFPVGKESFDSSVLEKVDFQRSLLFPPFLPLFTTSFFCSDSDVNCKEIDYPASTLFRNSLLRDILEVYLPASPNQDITLELTHNGILTFFSTILQDIFILDDFNNASFRKPYYPPLLFIKSLLSHHFFADGEEQHIDMSFPYFLKKIELCSTPCIEIEKNKILEFINYCKRRTLKLWLPTPATLLQENLGVLQENRRKIDRLLASYPYGEVPAPECNVSHTRSSPSFLLQDNSSNQCSFPYPVDFRDLLLQEHFQSRAFRTYLEKSLQNL